MRPAITALTLTIFLLAGCTPTSLTQPKRLRDLENSLSILATNFAKSDYAGSPEPYLPLLNDLADCVIKTTASDTVTTTEIVYTIGYTMATIGALASIALPRSNKGEKYDMLNGTLTACRTYLRN